MKSATVKRLVQSADNAKKANPLDLSSDQDLTIALMNLIHIENISAGFPELKSMVGNIRTHLMRGILDTDDLRWKMSVDLLGKSMRLMDDGMRALSDGRRITAYEMFDSCYGLYSIFWGINMDLVKPAEVGLN